MTFITWSCRMYSMAFKLFCMGLNKNKRSLIMKKKKKVSFQTGTVKSKREHGKVRNGSGLRSKPSLRKCRVKWKCFLWGEFSSLSTDIGRKKRQGSVVYVGHSTLFKVLIFDQKPILQQLSGLLLAPSLGFGSELRKTAFLSAGWTRW